jgi:hypothetical protein
VEGSCLADDQVRLDDNDTSSVDQLFEIRAPAKSNVALLTTSEANCFGILSESHSASSSISTDMTGRSFLVAIPAFPLWCGILVRRLA